MRSRNAYEALCLRLGAKVLLRCEQAGVGSTEQEIARGRNWAWSANVAPTTSPGRPAARCSSTGTHGTGSSFDVIGITSYSLCIWVMRTGTWANGHMSVQLGWFTTDGWFGLGGQTSGTSFTVVHGVGGSAYRQRISTQAVPLNSWSLLGMSGTIDTSYPDCYLNGQLDNGGFTGGAGTPISSITSAATPTILDGNGHLAYGFAIFNRALRAGEWAALYRAGRASGLVLP